jgi:hypothetical protein
LERIIVVLFLVFIVAYTQYFNAKFRVLEQGIKQSELKYRSLVNNVKLGICSSSPEPQGKFMEVNPAHGGTIWMKSQIGQGSKFSFSIPLNKQ